MPGKKCAVDLAAKREDRSGKRHCLCRSHNRAIHQSMCRMSVPSLRAVRENQLRVLLPDHLCQLPDQARLIPRTVAFGIRVGTIRLTQKTHVAHSQHSRREREFPAANFSEQNVGPAIARSAFAISRARERNFESLLGAQTKSSRAEDFVVGMRNDDKNVASAFIHLCKERRSLSAVSMSKGDWRSAASAAVREGAGCSRSSIAAFAHT